MYDLVGADDRRFSPFCWRIRMALAHKGLAVETRPTRFTEIKDIPGGQGRVPVLVDGARIVPESWDIAEFLEATYPEAPSLFGGAAGRGLSRFVKNWVEAVLQPAIVTMVVADVHARLTPEDLDYFRTSREARFGKPLDEVQAGREGRVEGLRQALLPLRLTLREQDFLGGDNPLFADHMVFGALQWPRVTSAFKLLEEDDPVAAWFERCLDLYGGIGRAMPAAA